MRPLLEYRAHLREREKGKSSRATADSSWAKPNLSHDFPMSAKVSSASIQGISAAQILQHRSA